MYVVPGRIAGDGRPEGDWRPSGASAAVFHAVAGHLAVRFRNESCVATKDDAFRKTQAAGEWNTAHHPNWHRHRYLLIDVHGQRNRSILWTST